MRISIHSIILGIDNCYIVKGEGAVLIDGGMPNEAKHFKKGIEQLSMKPKDIKVIILTHGHWDHIGSAKEIKDLTGAPIAMHGREKDWLEKSLKPLPPGVTPWGRVFVRIMALFMSRVHFAEARVDIVLGDQEFPLNDYGIPGKIIYTPGHSMGSISVLLESGDAFVGDLAMNGFPLRLGPGLPILAEDMQMVRKSWELLTDAGAKTIHPAHGKPFPVDVIRKALAKGTS